MYVEIRHGTTSDTDQLEERWTQLHETALTAHDSWLGSVAGASPEGEVVAVVCFAERPADADPKAGSWRQALDAIAPPPPAGGGSADVELVLGNPRATSGFVQVQRFRVSDRARFDALTRAGGELLTSHRPDMTMSYHVWLSDEVVYIVDGFTSEEDARRGEAAPMVDDLKHLFSEAFQLISDPCFVNLPRPLFAVPPGYSAV